MDEFQSTLPRGSDLRTVSMLPKWPNFNPRSLAGATSLWLTRNKMSIFQSTLPRGSDMDVNIAQQVVTISIHAPSRERPTGSFFLNGSGFISIHAPSRERQQSIGEEDEDNDFNPRSLAGATPCPSGRCAGAVDFNPRSLAGATKISVFLMTVCLDFNPRSLAGATNGTPFNYFMKKISIHAPSRERHRKTAANNEG